MKKRLTILLLFLTLTASLTACGEKIDDQHAYAEITFSTGVSMIAISSNSEDPSTSTKSALEKALDNASSISLQEGETVTVHFVCPECEHDETIELIAPTSKVFMCDCKEDRVDDNAGSKEYLIIIVTAKKQ